MNNHRGFLSKACLKLLLGGCIPFAAVSCGSDRTPSSNPDRSVTRPSVSNHSTASAVIALPIREWNDSSEPIVPTITPEYLQAGMTFDEVRLYLQNRGLSLFAYNMNGGSVDAWGTTITNRTLVNLRFSIGDSRGHWHLKTWEPWDFHPQLATGATAWESIATTTWESLDIQPPLVTFARARENAAKIARDSEQPQSSANH